MSLARSEPSPGVSLFAVPKPFHGDIGVIQRNALESWRRLSIAREIILMGDEEGTAEAAASAGARHERSIALDALGTPQVHQVFDIAERTASQDWLCYVNADIILMSEFGTHVARAIQSFERCLIVSRRWNLRIQEHLSFGNDWERELRAWAARESVLFNAYGIDVFVFPKGVYGQIPPFTLGRPYWDNWMISNVRQRGHPVVDVTARYGVIHQNHTYEGLTFGKQIRRGQQALRNFWLAGDSLFGLSHIGNATHYVEDGEIRPRGQKTVSVVIPHAGTSEQLRGCLRALCEQSYPRTYVEIIVVENSDRSEAVPVLSEFPFIKITREAKRGPAAARNKGAAIAQGEIISFLDSDCRPAGDWLEKGVDAAIRGDLKCIVACNIKPWDPGYGSAGVKWYEALAYHDQKGYVESCQACITGGMIVPREVWFRVGPFDEEFSEAACEDWEWSTRASSHGIRIVYAGDAVVRHPVHSHWRELRTKARRLVRGELLLARKRRRHALLDFGVQLSVYTRRWRKETRQILSDGRLRWYVKPSVSMAAFLVWLWSSAEVRRELATLPAYLSHQVLFRRRQGRERAPEPTGGYPFQRSRE